MKEMKFEIPAGCEVDKIETQDGHIVVTLKEKERKLPKSFEEFCEMFPNFTGEYFIEPEREEKIGQVVEIMDGQKRTSSNAELIPDHATAEAVLALCQLIQLRDCYNGDWVWCGSNYGQVTETFNFHGELLITVNNRRNKYFEEINPHEVTSGAEDIRPIPLTEEFFEKNGIKKVNDLLVKPNVMFESEDKRIQVTDITNSGDGYWNVHIDNEDCDTIRACDVRYVHQFQQLLRLCGYEMDVVV